MGDELIPPDLGNPKGYFENARFWRLNHQILHSIGSSWTNPPDREIIRTFRFPEDNIRTVLSSQVKSIWGLKHPLTVLSFEILRPHLEEVSDITYVFVHRPFEDSVRSLSFRDNISKNEATQILTPYFKNLNYYRNELAQENQDIIDVHYDTLLENPESFVTECNRRIGQQPDHNLDVVKSFLDQKLKHF
ncbi:sulfotransferase family protein [Effusibacillus consociatus]|uniref:Sulfotransferase family protein n=1 Tax=Effusibacillus consociatus TaxID=1117041 RepID=A0ABV9Q3X0_9BACL